MKNKRAIFLKKEQRCDIMDEVSLS